MSDAVGAGTRPRRFPGHTEFVVHVCQVDFYRSHAQSEGARNLLVAATGSHQAQHFNFSVRKPLGLRARIKRESLVGTCTQPRKTLEPAGANPMPTVQDRGGIEPPVAQSTDSNNSAAPRSISTSAADIECALFQKSMLASVTLGFTALSRVLVGALFTHRPLAMLARQS